MSIKNHKEIPATHFLSISLNVAKLYEYQSLRHNEKTFKEK